MSVIILVVDVHKARWHVSDSVAEECGVELKYSECTSSTFIQTYPTALIQTYSHSEFAGSMPHKRFAALREGIRQYPASQPKPACSYV